MKRGAPPPGDAEFLLGAATAQIEDLKTALAEERARNRDLHAELGEQRRAILELVRSNSALAGTRLQAVVALPPAPPAPEPAPVTGSPARRSPFELVHRDLAKIPPNAMREPDFSIRAEPAPTPPGEKLVGDKP